MVAVLVAVFESVHRTYRRIGAAPHLGEVPARPEPCHRVVVVPVGAVNLLTSEAISAALSLGDEVRAVSVVHPEDRDAPSADEVHAAWNAWRPGVPRTVLHSRTRSLPRPFVDHLRALAAQERQDRIVVLIPEMHLPRPWQRLLQNQRGAVLDRAVRRHTDAVICRLRFRIHLGH
ncbi:hypothetical protein ACFVAF_38340 [Streptomyces sp. NPDC057596]|uniref:hypothetical protein n=1 Tax=Streptomyces sp. NPDC057596 TaxID=3346178 RepID=UPI00367C7569